MPLINATQLAAELNVSAARISQYVSGGQLEGCFTGTGRGRRFDLGKCAEALGKRLDPGQMMGNGAATKAAIKDVRAAHDDLLQRDTPPPAPRREAGSGAGAEALPQNDPDRYELARIDKVEQEARKLRRQNAEAEGDYVLAAESARQVQRIVGQELREFESVLRNGARQIADRLGVDFKTARQILLDLWREHRLLRAGVMSEAAEAEALSETESAEDI